MEKKYEQANPDGTLEIGEEPVLKPERVKEIIKNALGNTRWNINWYSEERAQLQGTMTNSESESETLKLNIYCKPLSNTGRKSLNDKRIQVKDLYIV